MGDATWTHLQYGTYMYAQLKLEKIYYLTLEIIMILSTA
jgi:hypothetical protein